MIKSVRSDRGNTLVLVLGLAIVLSILVVPLVTMLGTGHRQAVMNAQYEKAHAKAESVARVFQTLLLADQNDLKNAQQIRDWASRLQTMNLCGGSGVVYDEANRNVTVSCTEGSGAVAETAPVKFQLNYNPSSNTGGGTGPGSVSDGTEFYQLYSVVAHNDVVYDKTFCTKQEVGPPVKLADSEISHTYDGTKYTTEFNKLIQYYTGANFTTRLHATERPAATAVIPATGAPSGDYEYKDGVAGYPTVNGNLTRTGNITINVKNNTTVRVNGNIVAGGNVDVVFGNNSKLIVTGVFHANAINFKNSGADLISVGQWSTDDWSTGTIVGNDRASLAATQAITFETGPAYVRVSGTISANALQASSASVTVNLKTGGDVVSKTNMAFGRVNEWLIGGSVATGGLFSFSNSVDAITIGGSLYADGGIQFQNTIGNTGSNPKFKVGGSVLAGGNVNFGNSTKFMTIGGDFVTTGTFYSKDLTNIDIAGSLISAGSLTVDVDSGNLSIGGSFLSGGSISFRAVYNNFNIDGLMGASQNITFTGNLTPGYNEFGGFYAGGNATFPNWYKYNGSNNGDCAIIVGHNPPPAGGGGSSGPKLVFGSWRS
ncbi:hypothetical protein [Cohnella sp. GCM10027633]|uniref:hypothetical protein n=1 Tax=unclassified Cohnella TaxID=2636738 RepID=UPI0036287E26